VADSIQVIEALVKIGQRLGVQYRFNASVSRITHEDGRATGIELQSGETLAADIVICNADLVYAYNNLLAPASTKAPKSDVLAHSTIQSSYAKSLAERPASCSSISFYWSLSQTVPSLSAHNIFLAEAYKESFDSIFKQHLIPTQPSFYVNVPSRIDPSAAPPSRDAIVVLVPVGHLLTDTGDANSTHAGTPDNEEGKQDWNAMVDLARTTILATIEARTGASLGPLITHEEVNTPASWREKFNLDRGAILGLSHSFFNVLCFRPSTRHQYDGMGNGASSLLQWRSWKSLLGLGSGGLRGLYFVGASTHPGTGVPICLAGGKVTSEQVLADCGVVPPWAAREAREGAGVILGASDALVGGEKSGGRGIDLVQRGSKLTGLEVLGYVVAFLVVGLIAVWLGGRK